jgi:hypothetical protein
VGLREAPLRRAILIGVQNLWRRLFFFALPQSLVGVVLYPWLYGWTRNAAELVAVWVGGTTVLQAILAAFEALRARRERERAQAPNAS